MSIHDRWFGFWLLLCCSILVSSCGSPASESEAWVELGDPDDRRPPAALPTRPLERRAATRKLPARWAVAWTDTGQLALFDGLSGQVLDEAEASAWQDDGQTKLTRDLAWDPYHQHLLIYRGDEQQEDGEITTVALDTHHATGPWFGAAKHRAWVDGRARLWPARGGIVVFEEGYGQRWKLLRDDGVPTPSVYASPPASAWDLPQAEGVRLSALTYGPSSNEPALQLTRAWVTPLGIGEVCTERLALSFSTVPLTARLVPLRSSDPAHEETAVLMVDLHGGHPVLRLAHAGVGMAEWRMSVGPVSARVEQALIMPGTLADGRRQLLALLSGPSRLLLASFGEGLSQVRAELLSLPGEVRVHDRFFSRDLLAVAPTRALVATDHGVWAVSIGSAATGLRSELDDGFDGTHLRGPLTAPHGGSELRPRP